MIPSWRIAKAETNQERRAALVAEKFYKIESFLPLVEQRTARSTRPVLMFPGYVFLRPASVAAISRLRHETFLVSYLLGEGDESFDLPAVDALVVEIRSRLVNGILPAKPKVSRFQAGQPVRVARGLNVDLLGEIFEADGGEERVAVLLTLFGRPVVVEMHVDAVEPVRGRAA